MEAFTGLVLRQPGIYFDTGYFVEEVIVHTRSRYQDIVVARLRGFGKSLILDGWLQSTEADEHIYHEGLVHPAMLAHPSPRRVLILGGGEGATLRETLRHPSVEEAVMVDIDPVVVDVAKRYLPEWHRGAFDDPRSRVVVMDGFEYVRGAASRGERFDVVIMDLTDPYGSEVAARLYSVEAFNLIRSVMGDPGVLVVQAGSSTFFPEAFERVYSSVEKVFGWAMEYGVWVPSFAYVNSFVATGLGVGREAFEPGRLEEERRRRGLEARLLNSVERFAMLRALAGVKIAQPGARE